MILLIFTDTNQRRTNPVEVETMPIQKNVTDESDNWPCIEISHRHHTTSMATGPYHDSAIAMSTNIWNQKCTYTRKEPATSEWNHSKKLPQQSPIIQCPAPHSYFLLYHIFEILITASSAWWSSMVRGIGCWLNTCTFSWCIGAIIAACSGRPWGSRHVPITRRRRKTLFISR